MSTYTVGSMLDFVEHQAQDEGNAENTQSELIAIYNMALRLISSLVPRAYTIYEDFQLASGVLQTLPSDGLQLVDVIMNMGTDGLTVGAAIDEADLDSMNDFVPDWTTETAATAVNQFMRIPGMDATFFVSPPSDGTGYIRVIMAAMPPTTTYDAADAWQSDKIPLSDEYIPAIPELMLFYINDQDTDLPGDEQLAMMHFQRASTILGVKDQQAAMRQAREMGGAE